MNVFNSKVTFPHPRNTKKKNTKKKTAVRGKICVTYSDDDDDDTYEPVKKMTRVVNVCENKLMLYTKSNR